MSDRSIDAQVAELLSIVPCEEWEPMNFGSAGGPALSKCCAHVLGRCYSKREIGSVFGKIGGPDQYSTDLNAAMRAYEEFRKQRGWKLALEHEPSMIVVDKRWCAMLTTEEDDLVLGEAASPSAAICAVILEAWKR